MSSNDEAFGLPPLPPGFEPLDPGVPAIGQVPAPAFGAAPTPKASPVGAGKSVAQILDEVSSTHGVDRGLLEAFAKIESGFNPKAKTGSYKGLFQLSDDEFARAGGSGDIYDPVSNATAAATKFKAEKADFAKRYGRDPSPSELYLIHQQGLGGADAHWSNPDAPAWQNMASTSEGRQKGDNWAKRAIWGNLPPEARRQFGDVNNVTSKDFVALWDDKVQRFGSSGRTDSAGSVELASSPGTVDIPPLPPGFAPVEAPSLGKQPAASTGSALPPLPTGFAPVDPSKPAEAKPVSFFDAVGRGVDQMQGMLYGGAEATGELVGSKALTDFGREGRTRNDEEAKAYGPAAEILKVKGLGDFGQWAKETIGSQIPIMGPMLGGAVAGSMIGGPIGAVVGAFVPGFVMSTGEVQSNIKEKDPNAVAPSSAFVGGAAIAALDSIIPGKVGSALVRRFGVEAAEEIAKRTLSKPVTQSMIKTTTKGVVTGMATEGVTEAMQEAIGDIAAAYGTGKPLDPNLNTKMLEAGAAGALMGGLMGPFSSSPQAKSAETQPPPSTSTPNSAAPPPTQPSPASSGPVPQPPSLAAPEEAVVLSQMGYSPVDIAGMTREEIDSELADGVARGVVKTPPQADKPSAEPISDLRAQLGDLKGGKRAGVYLSPDNLANIDSNPDFVRQLADAISTAKGAVAIADGQGGAIVVRDQSTADLARAALDAGVDPQKVIGALTGAGDGKKPGADTVVQQRTPKGEVTRETLVPANEATDAAAALAAPGRSVETMPAEAAVARREERINGEKATAGQVVGNSGELPTTFRPDGTATGYLPAQQALIDDLDRAIANGGPDGADAQSIRDLIPAPGASMRDWRRADMASDSSKLGPIRHGMGAVMDEFARRPAGDGSRKAPVKVEIPDDVAVAGQRVAEPTEAQKAAGNYTKGHARIQGLDITIENPKGSIRSGKDKGGKTWQVEMPATYGYVKRSLGKDGDQIDVYVGEDPASDRVWVIDQVDAETGSFDEHKAMLGFPNKEEALEAYRAAFSDGKGANRIGAVTQVPVPQFRAWVRDGNKKTKPLGDIESRKGGQSGTQPEKVAPKRRPPASPATALAFIRNAGGIRPDADLRQILDGQRIPGLLNKNGRTPDDMLRALEQANFIQDLSGPNATIDTSIQDLYDLVQRIAAGERVGEYGQNVERPQTRKEIAEESRRQIVSEAQTLTAELGARYDFTDAEEDRLVSLVQDDYMDIGDALERVAIESIENEAASVDGQASVEDGEVDGQDVEEPGATADAREPGEDAGRAPSPESGQGEATAEVTQAPETGPSDSGPVPSFAEVKALITDPKPMTVLSDYMENTGLPGWAKMTDDQRRQTFRYFNNLYAAASKDAGSVEQTAKISTPLVALESIEVEIDAEIDGGDDTVTLKMPANEALSMMDRRIKGLSMLKACLAK